MSFPTETKNSKEMNKSQVSDERNSTSQCCAEDCMDQAGKASAHIDEETLEFQLREEMECCRKPAGQCRNNHNR